MNFEAPREKIELQLALGFEAEMEPVIVGLIQQYIKQRLDVVLRLFFFFELVSGLSDGPAGPTSRT